MLKRGKTRKKGKTRKRRKKEENEENEENKKAEEYRSELLFELCFKPVLLYQHSNKEL